MTDTIQPRLCACGCGEYLFDEHKNKKYKYSSCVNHAQYMRVVASGLCKRCRQPNDRAPKLLCAQCAANDVTYYNIYQKQRKDLGLCSRCGDEKAREGRTSCANCAASSYSYIKKNRRKMLAENKCIVCGGEKDKSEKSRCLTCREKQSAYDKQRWKNRNAA